MTEINITNSLQPSKNNIQDKNEKRPSKGNSSLKYNFVTEKKTKPSSLTNLEVGFEHDKDVTNDNEFFDKIFSNNCYNPSSENLIDYYVEIRRMMDDIHDQNRGNVGTVVGMTVFGLFGFLGFSFTIVGGIAAGVLGGTLGRYAGKKLKKKMKNKGPITQEEIYRTKIECMTKVGKVQNESSKMNLNKFRIIIEKIIEESSLALNLDAFEEQKKMLQVLMRFREFLVTFQPQKAILLSYKLFKIHIKQQDLENPSSLEETAQKLQRVLIPYVKLLEISGGEKTNSKMAKKVANLVTYQKIKKLLAREEIQKILERFPDPKTDPEYLEGFKELMRQKVDLEKMKAEVEESFQGLEKSSAHQINKDGAAGEGEDVSIMIPTKSNIPLPNLDKSVQSIHSSEMEEHPCAKYLPYTNSMEVASRLQLSNFNPDKLKGSTVHTKQMLTTQGQDHKQQNMGDNDPREQWSDNSSEDSSGQKERALEEEEKLENDSALYHKQISFEKMSDSSKKKSNKSQEESKQDKSVIKIGRVLETPDDSMTQLAFKKPLPMAKRAASAMESVETKCDPSRTTQKPEVARMNSFSNLSHDDSHKEEEEKKEEKKEEIPSHRSSHRNMTGHLSRASEARFSSACLKPKNKTKKEIVFEKIISIAYDNVSKWDKVIDNEHILIHKIKPENSPVVLLRAWATIKGQAPMEIFNQIFDAESRSKWDTVLSSFRVVEQVDEDTDVIHFIIKTPFGFTERDFLQMRQYQHDYPEKGTSIISFQSTTHPSVPPYKNRVRGETHIAGYIIKPVEGDPNSTTLCILTQVDIKGNIPKAIVNMFAGKAPADWLAKLKKACIAKKGGK